MKWKNGDPPRLEANRQELFDHICRRMIKQGTVGCVPGRYPLYRNADGTKDCVGMCLPDALFRPEWNLLTVPQLAQKLSFTVDQVNLLGDLQDKHDWMALSIFPGHMPDNQRLWISDWLADFGVQQGLSITALTEELVKQEMKNGA